jgi:hypothetical protein
MRLPFDMLTIDGSMVPDDLRCSVFRTVRGKQNTINRKVPRFLSLPKGLPKRRQKWQFVCRKTPTA